MCRPYHEPALGTLSGPSRRVYNNDTRRANKIEREATIQLRRHRNQTSYRTTGTVLEPISITVYCFFIPRYEITVYVFKLKFQVILSFQFMGQILQYCST